MAHIENLIPCKPGETHNPNGRPKGSKNISTILREFLELVDPETQLTNAEAIALKLIKNAKGGKEKSIEMTMDRMEGKPLQKIESKLDALVTQADVLRDLETENVVKEEQELLNAVAKPEGALNADEGIIPEPKGQEINATKE